MNITSTRITTQNEHLRSWRAANYENYHEKWTSKKLKSRKLRELPPKMNIQEVEAPKQQKRTSFIVKTSFKSIRDQRKVRELPRKMNIEEVEEPKKYENCHEKWTSKKLKSRKSTRITTRNPFRTLSRASQNTEKYDNYHEKWTSKKFKSRKLRKFTYKSRSRRPRPARKYVNSHTKGTCKHETTKIATKSVRHLDLATRSFTTTVRTPSVKHTVWGKIEKKTQNDDFA